MKSITVTKTLGDASVSITINYPEPITDEAQKTHEIERLHAILSDEPARIEQFRGKPSSYEFKSFAEYNAWLAKQFPPGG